MKLNEEVTLKAAQSQGLTEQEFELIEKMLGRKPSWVELGVFAVMWSEHCSYKSSRSHLKNFPTKGERVLQGPGENAGIIDIGDGDAIVFKMESHNHPSYIEPYQGAATGIGGILRDIFTMGARPIALMDSLRFGSIDEARTPYLLDGVVAGIAGYGNCVGIPTVGGETYFHKTYNGNILVNVFCLGLVKKDSIYLGKTGSPGSRVIYLGSKTGRDGIHGATMASEEFSEETEEKRPTVQVGDPFTKKLLLEACLEMMGSGLVEGIQDMGAAGLTCSTFEMASRGNTGIEVDLNKVPKREEGMTPYELMLSESQERMLLSCTQNNVSKILDIAKKWGLDACDIGVVKEGDKASIKAGSETVCDIRAKYITDEAPIYDRPIEEPQGRENKNPDINRIKEPKNLNETIYKVLEDPNFASKKWIYSQYDHMVGTDNVLLPGSDAAVMRIKGTQKGIAMTVDCNSHYCYLNPYEGSKIAVCEAARNIVCSGAKPIGITDCLNFGNPENPHIMWEFSQAIRGISQACKAFNTPVTGGNVSFYNETNGKGIYPTPTIGMVGLINDISRTVSQFFKKEGDIVAIISDMEEKDLTQSEYLRIIHGIEDYPSPKVDIEVEKTLHETILKLADGRLLSSAHDCSDGGLIINLIESALNTNGCNIGVKVTYDFNLRFDLAIFSEKQSRIIVSFNKDNEQKVKKTCESFGINYNKIGVVEGKYIDINNYVKLNTDELSKKREHFFKSLNE